MTLLKHIRIKNLRGIREGVLSDLSKLVVLVGPNGSGKSAVLEACLIAGHRYPASAAGAVTKLRAHTWNGAKWVVHGGRSDSHAELEVEWGDGQRIRRRLQWDQTLVIQQLVDQLRELNAPGPFSAFRITREFPPLVEAAAQQGAPSRVENALMSVTGIAANNAFVPINVEQDLDPPPLQLVEPTRGEPLHDLFSRIVQEGRKDEALAIVRDINAEVTGIEILTESGEPRLFLTTKHGAAPASLGGDGVQALLRTVFELAGSNGGTVLLEEPEVHLHPRALHQVALAILGAVRRNRQVILTTHSQELIESLVALMSEEEIGDPQFLTVVRTRLTGGMLSSVSIKGSEVRSAFVELSEDLR